MRGRPTVKRDVELIRKLFDAGRSYRWLAREFRISIGTAYNIVNGDGRRREILI